MAREKRPAKPKSWHWESSQAASEEVSNAEIWEYEPVTEDLLIELDQQLCDLIHQLSTATEDSEPNPIVKPVSSDNWPSDNPSAEQVEFAKAGRQAIAFILRNIGEAGNEGALIHAAFDLGKIIKSLAVHKVGIVQGAQNERQMKSGLRKGGKARHEMKKQKMRRYSELV